MPSQVRTRFITAFVITALGLTALCLAAWWHWPHDAVPAHAAAARTIASSRQRLDPPQPSAAPSPTEFASDESGRRDLVEAGPIEHELAALLIPAICDTRRSRCECDGYPSRFAPEREKRDATTCQEDTLRDFRAWWREHADAHTRLVAEPERTRLLEDVLDCSATGVDVAALLVETANTSADEPSRTPCPLGMLTTAGSEGLTCVAPGASCTSIDQCGFDQCVGESEQRLCVANEGQLEDPGDHAHQRCGQRWCSRGQQCVMDECVPVVGEGERCEHAVCGPRTSCESRIIGGHCMANACLTTHPFRGSGWSERTSSPRSGL